MYASDTVTRDGVEQLRGRRGSAAQREVPRLGPDLDQAGVLEPHVCLEHRRDRHAALLGEPPNRREPVTRPQRSAIDRLAQLGGQMLVQEA